MRKTVDPQLPLPETDSNHKKVQELSKISDILDENRNIYDMVAQDLVVPENKSGAKGMTAEQVLRSAIIKQMEGYSYEDLAFHLEDSAAYRTFCRFSYGEVYAKSTLHGNIKKLTPHTWEEINRVILQYAEKKGVEKGRKARIDCTVVESNIHTPWDSELLVDSIRVLVRLMLRIMEDAPDMQFCFQNHNRRAKRRHLEIMNAKKGQEKRRKKAYKDLIKITENTVRYAESALKALNEYQAGDLMQIACLESVKAEIEHYLPLVRQVICQTTRRVLDGEKVAASDKLFSIFEEHTDIIIKDNRDTYYGHKVCFTGGASNLILDCVILDGNPADSTLTVDMIKRQAELYNRPPLKVALDGGFVSKNNLKKVKDMGVKDVCFSKGRGLEEKDMCRSSYVYGMLRKFRAGIESGISWLKRAFNLDRCTWKGLESFKSYVWSSVVSANLLTLARQLL